MQAFGLNVVISNDNRSAYIESLQEKNAEKLAELLLDCLLLEKDA
ncbi:MAG: hypothetical protein ACK5LM_04615 [Lactovum sp.]